MWAATANMTAVAAITKASLGEHPTLAGVSLILFSSGPDYVNQIFCREPTPHEKYVRYIRSRCAQDRSTNTCKGFGPLPSCKSPTANLNRIKYTKYTVLVNPVIPVWAMRGRSWRRWRRRPEKQTTLQQMHRKKK